MSAAFVPARSNGPLAICLLVAALLHVALLLGVDLPTPSATTMPTVAITLVPSATEASDEAMPQNSARAEPQAPAAKPLPPVEQTVASRSPPAVAARPPVSMQTPTPSNALTGENAHSLAQAVAKAAAADAPLRLTPATAPNVDFAYYLDAWRREVERVGQLNYPAEARAKGLAGTLRLRVTIAADGTLQDVQLLQTSGHAVLDDAAVRIVRLAAPYAPFSPTMRATTEVLEIERTWQFRNSRLST